MTHCSCAQHANPHQGVVVLNLLHGRLSGQGELDNLEMVQLLCRGSTAAARMQLMQHMSDGLQCLMSGKYVL